MTKILPIIAVSCRYLLKVYLLFARLRGLGLHRFAFRSAGADGAAAPTQHIFSYVVNEYRKASGDE